MTRAPSVLTIPDAGPELTSRLAAGLADVDALLLESVDHEDPFISEVSVHLVNAGGKRFRPLLTLLAAEACAGITDEVVIAATGVELTHLASLYHDDVMDEARLRRGVASVNAAYDNSTAILAGDLLFGTASRLVADLGAEAVRIQAETFVRLCAGQIRDDRPCPADVDPVAYHLGVLGDKTGALVATAAQYGAMFGGGDAETASVMRYYGEQLGMAFQLADDLIDITSDSSDSGKEPGTDLREGVDTLAVLYARTERDPAGARLRELLDTDLHDPTRHAEALRLLRQAPAVARAREHTLAVGREAAQALSPLPDGPAKRALETLAGTVVERVG